MFPRIPATAHLACISAAVSALPFDAPAPAPFAPASDLAVLIPAHNEADIIGETLDALARQTRIPERVIVVTDNCTDDTAAVAAAHGAEVLATRGNQARKAGALNQAIASLGRDAPTFVMVVDADTRLAPAFIDTAYRRLDADPALGAVSGLFIGDQPRGLLQRFQANEYTRYSTQVRASGRVAVVTGTASMFRTEALREVAEARGGSLPGICGDVYDRAAITEDSELTLALKSLGWSLTSPGACVCFTELMPTWGDLHRQRVRWYKGMLDNLRAYGITRVTARYIGQQMVIGIGILTIGLLLGITLLSVIAGSFAVSGFWLALSGVFVVDRLVNVWPGGTRARLLTASVVPELAYDIALQAAFVHAAFLAATGRDTAWNHVTAPRVAADAIAGA